MWMGPSNACTRPLLDLPSGRVCSSNTTLQESGALGNTLVLYIKMLPPHW